MVWRTDKGTAAWRKKVMSVSCDRDECKALAGKPCLYESGKPQRGFHSSREMKALSQP